VVASPCYPIRKPGEEHTRDRILTEDEIKKVWTALDQAATGTKAQRKLRILTAGSLKLRLITAQRGGEVLLMEWNDLDLNNARWTIPAEKSKNGLAHRVPLTSMALRIIAQMQTLTGGATTSPYIFPSPKDDSPIENVQKAIQRIKKTTAIDFVGHGSMKPLTREWIEKSEGDFATASRELKARKSPNYDAACFHAQQCVEKYFKALLQEFAIPFGKTHHLISLLELSIGVEPSMEM
jgi:hypothetical protein